MSRPSRDIEAEAGLFASGAELGALMHAHDWSASPLGRPDAWPQALRTLVSVMLSAKQPMFVVWGAARVLLYNGDYALLLGQRHPAALGRPFLEVWQDIADESRPLVDRTYAGHSTHMDDIELHVRRNGAIEETHFAFSYTPVRDEAGTVAGLFCVCTETTAQVLAERRRTQENKGLGQLFHQAPGFMCVLRGPDHVFEMANAAYVTFAGRDNLLGRPVREALSEIEAQGFVAMLDDVYATNQPRVGQGVPIQLQADPYAPALQRYVDFVCQPITDMQGRVTGIFMQGTDITGTHQANAALRAERDRCQAILESISDCFILLDDEFRVLQVNAKALRTDGRPASELLGQTYWQLWPGTEDSEAGRQFRHAVDAQEPINLDIRYVFPDGRTVWMEIRGYPSDGGLALFYRDVTERRCDEARLHESEMRFRGITDSIDHMVWSTLPDGFHDYYNQRWYDYIGVPPGSTDGEAWSGVFHPDDQQRAWTVWRHCLATGEPYHIEYRLRHRSGEYRWVLGRAQAVRDADGRIVRWYGTCTDIQEIVEARDVLARSREGLEQLIAARTAELVQANRRLQAEARERERAEDALRQSQKMEAVGQLTGGIAHDFNNMLQAVSGSLQVMQRRIAQGRPQDVVRYVDMAQQGVSRAATLTQRLLAFARRQALDPRPVVLDTLLPGMAELIGRAVGPSVEVQTQLYEGAGPVRCDANQLENALLNLAINARDAMPGGGRLTIRTAEARLGPADIAGHDGMAPGDYVEIAVSDTGAGMTPEVRARAFEPFFTTKPIGQGTGLGLSQLYGFVRQSGGLVRLESTPGGGTTVRILLPRHTTESSPADGAESDSDHSQSDAPETVLLVEDEAAIRGLVADALREQGYKVFEAVDGAAGLRLLQSGQVDLLVTDVGLPGLNGRQLADAGRVMQPGLKVLFITGYDHGVTEGSVFEPGMELIVKPFTLGTLVRKVRAMLEGNLDPAVPRGPG